MARKKKKRPASLKVDPSAISIRSGGAGVCTVLFDDSYLSKINAFNFDPIRVSRNQSPKSSLDKLRRLAGRGTWMAIEADPEIIDSDGVPGLDVVFRKKSRSSGNGPPKVAKPGLGFWYDPVTQLLDLPTGSLRVVFEPDFFIDGFNQHESQFEIPSIDDEDSNQDGYECSDSYLINCKPGFYHATVFSCFYDWEDPDEESRPELAVYLTPFNKPKSFPMSDAILPVFPADQDHETLKRASLGLPPRKPQKPTLQKKIYLADVRRSIGADWMEVPAKFQKMLGVEPGVMLRLEVEGKDLDGIVTESSTPDPTVWDLVEKEKRKSKNFAIFQFVDDTMLIEILKVSRKDGFDLPEEVTVTGRLQVVQIQSGEPKRIAVKQKAKDHAKTVQIPKRVGKPGEHVARLIPEIEKCFAWTQCCLIELDGKTMMAGINICPPIKDTDVNGKPYTMAAEITATFAEYGNRGEVHEESKNFRKWPDGVGNAFKWVAQKSKGGMLWKNRFELKRNFLGRKQSGQAKRIEKLAVAAWQEVFGI